MQTTIDRMFPLNIEDGGQRGMHYASLNPKYQIDPSSGHLILVSTLHIAVLPPQKFTNKLIIGFQVVLGNVDKMRFIHK